MRWAISLVFLVCCSRAHEKPTPLQPLSDAEALELANNFAKAARPCDVDKLGSFIDREAFRELVTQRDPDHEKLSLAVAEGLIGSSIVATKVCAWLSTVDEYKFLRLHRDAESLRAVMRRRTGMSATYHELELIRSHDGKPRVSDVYSYFKGQWLSEEFALLGAASERTGVSTGITLQRVTMLEKSQPDEALALLDQLPANVRALRSIQGWRVKLSQQISMEAYGRALEELERHFPRDPSVALLEIDAAFLRGDLTSALRFIDVVEKEIGQDAILEANRALMLVMRNAPGDVDAAAASAERALHAEPDLEICQLGGIAVAVGRQKWSDALAMMDQTSQRFGTAFNDEVLTTSPLYTKLVQTPEYAAWRAKHSAQ